MILYLIKSSICLSLLIITYHLLLEKEKMHKFNRLFLLLSIVFSFTIPLLQLDISFIFLKQSSPLDTVQIFDINNANISTDSSFKIWVLEYLTVSIYFLGLVFMLNRFIKNLYTINNLKKKGKLIRHRDYNLVLLDQLIHPHSFLSTIFINKSLYEKGKINECIIQHELSHIKQKHSLDIIFIEVLQSLLWFNPILIFYKKAIKLNHEFLADSAVIESIDDSSIYINTLLKNIFRNNPSYMASSINYSLTKKRFIMMTKNKSKTKMLFKQLVLIPIFISFIFLFSTKVEAQEKGAPRELMREYISKTKDNIINAKDVKRLNHIYGLMSEKQRKSVNPIPPPPPPTKSKLQSKWKVETGYTDKNSGKKVTFLPKSNFYINGKKVAYKKVEKLDPDTIKSIDVKKNEGKKGAVYIVLK